MNGARRQQRGVAMITAVMVVAFATTVGAALMVKQNLVVHRSGNLIAQDQAWWYLVGLEQWAATLLDRDREDNQYDHLGEPWSQAVDFLPVEEGVLSGALLDLQGRFNLNSLLDDNGAPQPERQAQFMRLLSTLEDIKAGEAQELTSAIIDWMDSDTEPTYPAGAEDGVYLSLDRPYRTSNLPFVSVSELRLVQGMTPKLYAALRPLVSVRPGEHRINVNTAPIEVLMSLSDKLDPGIAEALATQRLEKPWESDEQFITDSLVAGLGLSTNDVTVSSHYFQAETTASIGHVRLSYVSLLERPDTGKTRVIAHSRNVL